LNAKTENAESTENTPNRLQFSASPYLRSAAHQPIDWHEWGDEVFEKASAEGKPILLDIGAVWCHWCHVIDRESYENPELAAIIRQFYIAVKVDRDERPDVDARYQAAISAISGQGGWPLTAFLTPDGKPFFGGTYFPPEDAMGRPGFRRILLSIAEAFRTRRADVDTSAKALADAVANAEAFRGAKGALEAGVVDSMVNSIAKQFDDRNGGFGTSPKFPHAAAVDLLLERYRSTKANHLLEVAETTLEKMALGGVYDQIGGGFHRYSVDERWCVPHFEKMTYDNSELLRNYLHGFQVTGKPLFRDTAKGIIGWVDEVLSDRPRGGFYASQDADQTLNDDGDYFTWSVEEVRHTLSPEAARVVEIYYHVEPRGEMHHNPAKNVLWIAHTVEQVAHQVGASEAETRLLLQRAKEKLLAARRLRPTPVIDTTIYVGWNAMFVSAYLDAGRVLGRADCIEFALRTLDRLLAEGWDENKGFAHRIGGNESPNAASAPRLEGSLDDHVFAGLALLDAYEATLDLRYFQCAERTLQLTIERFGDPDEGGFFDRAKDAAPMRGLDIRRKPLQDSPTPSANSMAVILLERIHGLTGKALYHRWAELTLESFAAIAPKFGLFGASYALGALLHQRHTLQVVITGAADDPQSQALEQAANSVYRFGKSVLRVTPEKQSAAKLPPALAETIPHLNPNVPQAIVCVETTCHPPTADPEQLLAIL
jgi:uncharacterized protein YyaL (SSP411 family)